jgi:hypothetical protein
MDELFGIARSRFRHGITGAIDEEIGGLSIEGDDGIDHIIVSAACLAT